MEGRGNFCMPKDQLLNKINQLESQLSLAIQQYWREYSSFETWQFWFCALTLVIPFVAYYFLIDRKKIFVISFFGYTYHVFLSYVDAFMSRHNFWEYPYFLFPFLSSNIAIDASLIPVSYLLVYQYTVNKNKNFYLYGFILSFIFAFLFAGMLQWLGMFRLTNGMNNFYLFLVDYGLALIAFWLTSLFCYLHKKQKVINL
jgi:hypothetical protein